MIAPLSELYYGNTSGSSAAGAHQITGAPGAVTPTIYDLTNGAGSVIAARWAAIPEPSAAILGAFGSLLLLRRRR